MIPIIMSINVIIFLLIGHYLLNQYKQIKTLQVTLEALEKTTQQIQKDHPVLVHADLVFSKTLNDINAQLISMDNQIQSLENLRANDGGYQHALRILEMGGDREEIVKSCHLSNAEADLLINLQAYRTAIEAI